MPKTTTTEAAPEGMTGTRIDFRQQGDFMCAYVYPVDTPEDKIMVSALHMTIVNHPELRTAWRDLLQRAVIQILRNSGAVGDIIVEPATERPSH